MNQTTTGLFVIGWKLALALIAGIPVLTTVGVWALARFTTVFDAYAEERAKLLAQFHNLDRLVEQTEKLTATTETIKARISDEMWDRQMRWNFKRDLYVGLLEALGEMRIRTARQKGLKQVPYSTDPNSEFERRRWKSADEIGESTNKFLRAADVSPVVVSDGAYRIIKAVVETPRPLNLDAPDWERQLDRIVQDLERGMTALQEFARKDLGYDLN